MDQLDKKTNGKLRRKRNGVFLLRDVELIYRIPEEVQSRLSTPKLLGEFLEKERREIATDLCTPTQNPR
jgi:hypothetical protein